MLLKPIIAFSLVALFVFCSPAVANRRNYNQTIEVVNFETFRQRLSKDTDSVYVINFWATWCAPCIREIPYFERLNSEYNKQGVKVLLVSLDFPSQLESRVVPFVENLQIESEVIILNEPNANRWIPLVSEKWTGAIPATIIYNRHFREFYEGELSFEELEAIIKPLVSNK